MTPAAIVVTVVSAAVLIASFGLMLIVCFRYGKASVAKQLKDQRDVLVAERSKIRMGCTREFDEFLERWSGHGNERSDCHMFWLQLTSILAGLAKVQYDPMDDMQFERSVRCGNSSCYADVYLKGSHVLIEQKSFGKSLSAAELHSGLRLTPYQQAFRYGQAMVEEDPPVRVRHIILCNFEEFRIFRMDAVTDEVTIPLNMLPKRWSELLFLFDDIKAEQAAAMHADELFCYNVIRYVSKRTEEGIPLVSYSAIIQHVGVSLNVGVGSKGCQVSAYKKRQIERLVNEKKLFAVGRAGNIISDYTVYEYTKGDRFMLPEEYDKYIAAQTARLICKKSSVSEKILQYVSRQIEIGNRRIMYRDIQQNVKLSDSICGYQRNTELLMSHVCSLVDSHKLFAVRDGQIAEIPYRHKRGDIFILCPEDKRTQDIGPAHSTVCC